MKKRKFLSIASLSAIAAMVLLVVSTVMTEAFYDSARFSPVQTIQMIERHLQEGRTNLSSDQIPSVARTLFEEARSYGIDYRLVLAIMAVESNFRNDAVSQAGARGIMQVMPILAASIAAEAGIPYRGEPDLFEPVSNVRFALHYLSWLSANFKDTSEVLLAYNVGHNRAKRLLSKNGGADTRYTRRVLGQYRRNMTRLPAM
ncbi:MAG: Membrane-bound lytic murein transglycosylase C precursor [Syntrophaceae bacterium PtaU1.Bin231]|nr:MAG: Membrane-bound lytic murein transglycosylase C precursor [Syntrophaceae bacterium PtaU1.Bin231]HOG15777.1 lytic transglycosylase domain-containing protein [Syntrophales bacterium]